MINGFVEAFCSGGVLLSSIGYIQHRTLNGHF